MGELLVNAVSVEKSVGGEQLLAPVSFRISAGECLAVTGPNGSGKTTLLRILIGLDHATRGSVGFSGPLAATPRTGLASAMGSPPFYEDLVFEEHLELIRTSWGGEDVTGPYGDLLGVLKLERILRRFPSELSSGERQAAGLVFALLRPARLLVLDEPEQRLDDDRRRALGILLAKRVAAGTAIIMASHDAELVDTVADARVQLEPGGIRP